MPDGVDKKKKKAQTARAQNNNENWLFEATIERSLLKHF